MNSAFQIAVALSLIAAPAFAGDTDAAAIAAARSYVLAALPGECDEKPEFGDSFAYRLAWKPDWGGDDAPEQHATLYQIFCFSGAYNLVHAYVFKPENGNFSLMAFARPTYTYDYADEQQTELKSVPQITGFSATSTLVNSGFDADTNTLSSSAKWRGLGDAWSGGTWALRAGQFVLKSYDVDPTYDLNNEDATEEQSAKYYRLYP